MKLIYIATHQDAFICSLAPTSNLSGLISKIKSLVRLILSFRSKHYSQDKVPRKKSALVGPFLPENIGLLRKYNCLVLAVLLKQQLLWDSCSAMLNQLRCGRGFDAFGLTARRPTGRHASVYEISAPNWPFPWKEVKGEIEQLIINFGEVRTIRWPKTFAPDL